jgi:hypothetical protein
MRSYFVSAVEDVPVVHSVRGGRGGAASQSWRRRIQLV